MTTKTLKVPKKSLDRAVNRNNKIRACRGLYSVQAVADYFACSQKHVYELWAGDDLDVDLGVEPPNIWTNKMSEEILYEEAIILCGFRNASLSGAAEQLGVTPKMLARILRKRPTGRAIVQRSKVAAFRWRKGRACPEGSYGVLDRSQWPNNI